MLMPKATSTVYNHQAFSTTLQSRNQASNSGNGVRLQRLQLIFNRDCCPPQLYNAVNHPFLYTNEIVIGARNQIYQSDMALRSLPKICESDTSILVTRARCVSARRFSSKTFRKQHMEALHPLLSLTCDSSDAEVFLMTRIVAMSIKIPVIVGATVL